MANDGTFDPRNTGADLKEPGAVDLAATPEVMRRILAWGVDAATGLYQALETEFTGTFTDEGGVHRLGRLVATISDMTLEGKLAALIDAVEDIGPLVEQTNAKLSILHNVVTLLRAGTIADLQGFLRAPIVQSAEAAEEASELMEPIIARLGNVQIGTDDLRTLVNTYDAMVFGLRNICVNQPQDHVNGPARLANISGVAIANGYANWDVFCNPYALITVYAKWTNNNAAESIRLDLFGRIDDNAAWAVAPTTTPSYNGLFTVVGSALGVPVQNGELFAFSTRPMRIREFRAEYLKAGAVAGNDSFELWETLGAAV